ncbi:hypothetical protein, partial [Sulfitobacter sp. 1A12779]|uniref:hypothetical protein n=1 Tax=Sulfitobacter sp. 1A12779 TaxID=3368599 RepID=UPI0037455682
SDLAEKLTCEPETDIRHCAASPELWVHSCHSLRSPSQTALRFAGQGRLCGTLLPFAADARFLLQLGIPLGGRTERGRSLLWRFGLVVGDKAAIQHELIIRKSSTKE